MTKSNKIIIEVITPDITSFAIDHYPFEHKDGWGKT